MNSLCSNFRIAYLGFVRARSFPGSTLSIAVLMGFNTISVQAQDVPKDVLQPVVVTATPFENRSELDIAQPVSVLKGDDLRRKREASLGDTLSRELGVASSSFGPGAGRPTMASAPSIFQASVRIMRSRRNHSMLPKSKYYEVRRPCYMAAGHRVAWLTW